MFLVLLPDSIIWGMGSITLYFIMATPSAVDFDVASRQRGHRGTKNILLYNGFAQCPGCRACFNKMLPYELSHLNS